MNEIITTVEIQAEIITKLRGEKNQLAAQVEQLKAKVAELTADEKPSTNTRKAK